MDWSSILSQARSGSLVFWAGFAAAAGSLTRVAALVYILTRRSIWRRRVTIDRANAEQSATHTPPAELPPNSIRAAAAYAQEVAGSDCDRGCTDAGSPAALLARLQHTSARMEQMVAESRREA